MYGFGRWLRNTLVMLILAAFSVERLAYAQELPTSPLPPTNPLSNPSSGGNLVDFILKKSPYEFWLTFLIMTFGLIVIALYIYAIRNIDNRRPEEISRALIVITVITGSLVLITAGYSNDQIAPAFGLFGTVVGYMLGRMSSAPNAVNGASSELPTKNNRAEGNSPADSPTRDDK